MENINRKARFKKVMIVISVIWLGMGGPFLYTTSHNLTEFVVWFAAVPIFWVVWWIWNGNK